LRVKLLCTDGKGTFNEIAWDKPAINNNEIEVKAVMTGVCRSDIDMMNGEFGPLPIHMHGHEGLGIVTKVGSNITDVEVGNYVATRGEPAYADYYNVRKDEYVSVPSADPKYILEPVACGINVVNQNLREVAERAGEGRRLLILGSGFLAWVAYNTLLINHLEFDITVIGRSNQDLWQGKLSQELTGVYDVIIDLTERTDYLQGDCVANNGLIIIGTDKHINQTFGQLIWKAVTISFPSPRTPRLYEAMVMARDWVADGQLQVDKFWTRSYNRNTEWQSAFADGVNRPAGYSRGYIKWD
jgi:Alcohol dehydrogenase GroES-like domain